MGKGKFSVNEARKSTPPPGDDMPAWIESLREAAYNSICEEDVRQIVEGMVKRAKEGDAAAVKMVFEYLLKRPSAPFGHYTQNNLVLPTEARSGSRNKINAMADRAANGQELFHPDDAAEEDDR